MANFRQGLAIFVKCFHPFGPGHDDWSTESIELISLPLSPLASTSDSFDVSDILLAGLK